MNGQWGDRELSSEGMDSEWTEGGQRIDGGEENGEESG